MNSIVSSAKKHLPEFVWVCCVPKLASPNFSVPQNRPLWWSRCDSPALRVSWVCQISRELFVVSLKSSHDKVYPTQIRRARANTVSFSFFYFLTCQVISTQIQTLELSAIRRRSIFQLCMKLFRTALRLSHLSNPRNASGSMVWILFSYNVNISSVSNPSNARLWTTDILLWFRFKINRWCRLRKALDGTFCSWFCDTSSCVNPLPVIWEMD